MVRRGKRVRGGFSGRGRHQQPPSPISTLSEELSSKMNKTSSSESDHLTDDEVYDTISETSKTNISRKEISIQASISNKSRPDDTQKEHMELSEGEAFFNKK